MTKSWDDDFPAGFPIDAISRRAMQEGAARQKRRRARRATAGATLAVLLVGAGLAATITTDEGTQQLAAGPSPLPTVAIRATNGKIAFVRSTGPDDPAPKLFVMDGDGSKQTLVRELPGLASLAWSPDGTQLAFDSGSHIFTMSGDGGGLRQLTTEGMSMWPTWSPDGTRIAYRSWDSSGAEGISVMDADGGNQHVLVTGTFVGHATWSPDGGSIAYTGDVAGGISVVKVENSTDKRTLPTGGFAEQPAWSPDGTRIAFRRYDGISVVNADGSAPRSLVSPPPTGQPTPPGGGTAVGPTWSPDGTKIAYSLADTGERCSIWTMNADGSGRTQLTDGTRCDRDPAWQPIPRP